ncbi:MAG: histidine phosphatase family protein [Oscillospiraceae bacterium]|nr:histidine phosphatase family protein [Oscillospiraceae bacterium]
MKLIIIRHGDPNYEIDSLTEKGWKEAAFLAEKMSKQEVTEFYVSPLGRAQDTASLTLKKMNRSAETCPWLREFHAPVIDEETGEQRIPWDMLPADWTAVPEYYDKNRWFETERMRSGDVISEAKRVYSGLDEIIAKHGYVRCGNYYNAVKPCRDTVVLFCHFGVECVMLGYLLGISPVVLWHGFCAAPTSVTTLITEERRNGIACFRMSSFGDVSHLYAAGEEPSFAARFCETFDCKEERHD